MLLSNADVRHELKSCICSCHQLKSRPDEGSMSLGKTWLGDGLQQMSTSTILQWIAIGKSKLGRLMAATRIRRGKEPWDWLPQAGEIARPNHMCGVQAKRSDLAHRARSGVSCTINDQASLVPNITCASYIFAPSWLPQDPLAPATW